MAFDEPMQATFPMRIPAAVLASSAGSFMRSEVLDPHCNDDAGRIGDHAVAVHDPQTSLPADPVTGAGAVKPEMAAQFQAALARACAAGRVPVVRCGSSMGRAAWMRAMFPDALHLIVLRRPDAQWGVARRHMDVHHNPYYVMMPLLMLARNADAPVVAQACRALRVALPRLRQDSLARAVKACDVMAERLSREDRYRGFLAFWLAEILSALAADCRVMNTDMLLWSQQYRRDAADMVARRSGLALGLSVDPGLPASTPPVLDRDGMAAHQAALALLHEHRATLRAESYLHAWTLLAAGLVAPAVPAPGDSREQPMQPPPSPYRSFFRNLSWFRNPWTPCTSGPAEPGDRP